jgi:hypothetical protein
VIKVRLDLRPAERQRLERLTREEWQSWRLSESVPGDIGQGFRADALIIDTERAVTRVGCTAVELPHHGEAFRLQIDDQKSELLHASEQSPVSPLASAKVFQALDVGKRPQLFLLWRMYEYPDEALAAVRGIELSCADALLIRGPERQLLVQVSRVPTWLTLTVDDKSIERVIAAAQEIELLA